MNFHVIPSLLQANTYFIFREIDERNCNEIRVVIRNNLILPDKNILPDEANYFRENILEKGDKRIK